MKDNAESYEEEADIPLELALTMLRVEEDELVRINRLGSATLRIPLEDIQDIEYRARFDPFSLFFLAVGSGLGCIAYFVVPESPFLSVLLYVAALILLGFVPFGLRAWYIVIRASVGETDVLCKDPPDEVAGFVNSMRLMIKDQ